MAKATQVVQSTTSSLTLIEFLLDETGSMSSCREATIAGFNEYIKKQRNGAGNAYITLTKFDVRGYGGVQLMGMRSAMVKSIAPIATTVMPDQAVVNHEGDVRTMYTDVPVDKVEFLTEATYAPHGSTNLYDAVATRIHALNAREAQYPGASKLIVIMTDGQDNASREYNAQSLKSLISQKEADGWTFVFLGANQDAWAVGQTFGMSKGNTMTYSTDNIEGTMSTLSAATTNFRGMRASGAVASNAASESFFSGISDDTAQDIFGAADALSKAFLKNKGVK